jgi:DNA end-binding protein Ku
VTKDELENIALESKRTIEIDEFVPRSEIDDLYLLRPYNIVSDGKNAVIRETIRSLDKIASLASCLPTANTSSRSKLATRV